MHRTLKAETTRPARDNLLQQLERFDQFVEEFNTERPHEALDMKRPADVYVPAAKKHPAFLPETSPVFSVAHSSSTTITRSTKSCATSVTLPRMLNLQRPPRLILTG